MTALIARRLLASLLTLFAVLLLTFVLLRAAPGGPFAAERDIPPAVLKVLEARIHLDESVPIQFLRYCGDLMRGDLGPTRRIDLDVNEVLAQTLPVSATLGSLAFLLALALGGGLGLLAAARSGSAADRALMATATLGLAVPTFVIGPLLAWALALHLGWFRVAGWGTWDRMVLPACTLALPFAARIARLTRTGVVEALQQEHIRTARAKGLGGAAILLRHALKSGCIPVVTYLGPAAAGILTGSVVVEGIFNVPGFGQAFVLGVMNRDYYLVAGGVAVYSALLVTFNLLVDGAVAWLDPRTRM